VFFFEKKNQKTFAHSYLSVINDGAKLAKVSLLLSFQRKKFFLPLQGA